MRYLAGVTTLSLDAAACTGCGRCAEVCPHGVFAVEGLAARIVERDRCMECGACERNCEAGAVSVRSGVGCAMALSRAALARRRAPARCGEGCGCSGSGP